jgi:hypothetical protein
LDQRQLIPADKFDVDAVRNITAAGYPAIAPILDELLDWTADSNWPIARPLSDFLITLGDPLVVPLSRILSGTDGTHKEHCIRLVISRLPIETLAGLETELRRLAEQPTADDRREGVDAAARQAMSRLSG